MSASTTSRNLLLAASIVLGLSACGPPRPLDTGAPLIDTDRPLSYLVWQKDVGRALEFPPVAAEGTWLVASTGGKLIRLDGETGEELWARKLPGTPSASPVLCGRMVVMTSDVPSGEVVGIELDSGKEIWKWGRAVALPAGGDSLLVLSARSGRVIRLDPRDGTEVWESHVSGAGWKAPLILINQDLVVVPARLDSLVALRLGDGERVWAQEVGAWAQIGAEDTLLVAAGDDSSLVSLDPGTGAVTGWIRTGAMPAGPPVVRGGVVFLALRNGTVMVLETERLQFVWRQTLDPPLVSPPLVHDIFVLQAAPRGHVFALDRWSGEKIGVLSHPEILLARPEAAGDELAVGGNKGTLAVYRRER